MDIISELVIDLGKRIIAAIFGSLVYKKIHEWWNRKKEGSKKLD